MALALSRNASYTLSPRTFFRGIETSAANTTLASTLPVRGNPFRIVLITVAYSAVPVQTGVTVDLTSGAGAAYSCNLLTGTANARYTSFIPTNDLVLAKDDSLTITAPAGGGVITASVVLYLEDL